MHARWGDSIQNEFTKVVWFEYFGYFVRKNVKKTVWGGGVKMPGNFKM